MIDKLKKNKKIVIGAILIVIAAILLVLLLTNVFKKDNNKSNHEERKVESDEKSIEEDYHFTKDDAINIIKKIYNSDNYEFDALADVDNTYIVTVTNTDTNESTKYKVDPSDGSFSVLDN